jgi:Reverse transcriptase (RNA-dependent DNA polymerase)
MLVPLTALFNSLFASCTVPKAWGDTLMSLIFKKGDPALWGNYRPIAVVNLFAKVYAMVLNDRLSTWAEANCVRSPTQTGFRPHRATTHNIFTLQHVINSYKAQGNRPLYCCFIDLAKAYDSVPRDKLWARLHHLGIRGRMLFAVKSLYDCGTALHIKTPLGMLDPIFATVGVKQGCPLSPTLFSLFIDSLPEFVALRCPYLGPMLRQRRVPVLLHCDDTALLADSQLHLQLLLDLVNEWCHMHGMDISVVKSVVVVFNREKPPPLSTCRLKGVALPVRLEFLYLGVLLHCTKGVKASITRAATRGRAATAAMLRRLHELDLGSSVRTTLSLYSAGPMQAMLYGCEVWGQHCMSTADPAVSGLVMEQVHRNFVRHTLGMRQKCKAWVAFREAGMYPLQHACLARMLKFVENILALPAADVCRKAMLECIDWAHQPAGVDLRGAWVQQLVALVAHVCPADVPLIDLIDLPRSHLDVDACMRAWRSHYHATVWGGLAADPRTAPSLDVTMCTYHRCFAMDLPIAGEHWLMPPHLTTPRMPLHHVLSISRFRTGCHDLAVQRLRMAPAPGGQRVPRQQRYCFCCIPVVAGAERPVQDELHCILECTSLHDARASYPSLFAHTNAQQAVHPTLQTMFTAPGSVRALASFVHTHVLPMGAVLAPLPPT